jgi:hypothetical protein
MNLLLLSLLLLVASEPLPPLSALAGGTLLHPTASASAKSTGTIVITDFFICLLPPSMRGIALLSGHLACHFTALCGQLLTIR